MSDRDDLAGKLDQILEEEEVERFLANVPYAAHLTDCDQDLDEAYYLRHRVETVKRIRLTSKTDALALTRMVDEDYDAARWWSKYLTEELDHDLLYLRDLRAHGYTAEAVHAIEPFSSTRSMPEASVPAEMPSLPPAGSTYEPYLLSTSRDPRSVNRCQVLQAFAAYDLAEYDET